MADSRKRPWSDALLSRFGLTRKKVKGDSRIAAPRLYDDAGDLKNPYFEWLQREMEISGDRLKRYKDYEEMDRDSEVSAVLDAYAEEATQMSVDRHATVWAEAQTKSVEQEINALFAELEIEDRITGLARMICKYGDNYERLAYTEEEGIVRMLRRDPGTIRRLEEPDFGLLRGFNEEGEEREGNVPSWKPWDLVHWRLMSSRRVGDDMYGDSILEDARGPWRRLKILEDSLTLYRIQNAPDRFVFYVDMQVAAPEERWRNLNFWRRKFRKNSWWDPVQGTLHSTHNPQALDEAIFWPQMEGSTSRVERLAGSANIADIADIQYFRNKLYTAFRLPTGYIGGDSDAAGFNPHLTLAAQDLRVARRVRRIQRAVIIGLVRMIQIHYAVKYRRPISYPKDFRLGMVVVNVEDQMRRMEVAQARIDTATRLRDLTSGIDLNADALKVFILGTILGLTRDEIIVLTGKGPSTIDVSNSAAGVPDEFGGGGSGGGGGFPSGGAGEFGSDQDQKGEPVKTGQGMSPESIDDIFKRVGNKMAADPGFRSKMGDLIQEIQEGDVFGDIYTPVKNDLTPLFGEGVKK